MVRCGQSVRANAGRGIQALAGRRLETDRQSENRTGIPLMWIQLKQAYFGKSVGEKLDVDESHAKLLVEKGIADAL